MARKWSPISVAAILGATLLAGVVLSACKSPRECGPVELGAPWESMGLPLEGGQICETYRRGRIDSIEVQFDDASYDDMLHAFRTKIVDLGWARAGDDQENPEGTLYTATYYRADDQLQLVVEDISAEFARSPVLVALTRSARLSSHLQ